MTKLRALPPLTIALMAATGAGALALILVLAPSIVFAPTAKVAVSPAPPLPARDARPLKDYAAIWERPLFDAQRKPVASPREFTQHAPPPLDAYRIVGIVIAADNTFALVRRESTGEVVTLRRGDDLDGRPVEDIHRDGVLLGDEFLSAPRARKRR